MRNWRFLNNAPSAVEWTGFKSEIAFLFMQIAGIKILFSLEFLYINIHSKLLA